MLLFHIKVVTDPNPIYNISSDSRNILSSKCKLKDTYTKGICKLEGLWRQNMVHNITPLFTSLHKTVRFNGKKFLTHHCINWDLHWTSGLLHKPYPIGFTQRGMDNTRIPCILLGYYIIQDKEIKIKYRRRQMNELYT